MKKIINIIFICFLCQNILAEDILLSSDEFYISTLSSLYDIRDILINLKICDEINEENRLYNLSYAYLQYINSSFNIIYFKSEINYLKHVTSLLTKLIINELEELINFFENSSAKENIDEIIKKIDLILILYTDFLIMLSNHPFYDLSSWYIMDRS
ncbi:MAG: hypothetical protein FWD28_04975 [Treponema sp.]|nr:hypothetical protein [Treponema sp.]